MMKRSVMVLVFFLFSAIYLTGCINDDEGNNSSIKSINWLEYTNGMQEGSEKNKPIILDFYADWCPPCNEMDRVTYNNDEVIENIMKNFIPIKINVDDKPQLSNMYGISSIPTIIYLNHEGGEIYKTIGYRSSSQFLYDMETALNRITD